MSVMLSYLRVFLIICNFFWLLCCIFQLVFPCVTVTKLLVIIKQVFNYWLRYVWQLLFTCSNFPRSCKISSLLVTCTLLWVSFSCPATRSSITYSLKYLHGVFVQCTSMVQGFHGWLFLCHFYWLLWNHLGAKIWVCLISYLGSCVSRVH